jgi:hypothetical protein
MAFAALRLLKRLKKAKGDARLACRDGPDLTRATKVAVCIILILGQLCTQLLPSPSARPTTGRVVKSRTGAVA